MNAVTAGPLQGAVDPRLVFTDISATTLSETFGEVARRLVKAGVVTDAEDLTRRLLERERLGATALGGGIAIPHCKLKNLDDIVLAVASCRPGIDFRSPDGAPVTLLFFIVSPVQAPGLHLQALARVSRLLKAPGVADALREAETPEAIAETIRRADAPDPRARLDAPRSPASPAGNP